MRILALLTVVVAAVGCRGARLGGPEQLASPGEGGRLTARLLPTKDRYVLGEPVWLRFEVHNPGTHAIALTTSHATTAGGRLFDFDLKVRDLGTGRVVERPDSGPAVGSIVDSTPIAAGATYAKQLFLPHWADVRAAGRYRVELSRALVGRVSDAGASSEEFVVFTQTACEFDIHPADHEQLGLQIDRFGEALLGSEDPQVLERSRKSLAYIHDARTLRWWSRVLETGHSGRMYDAASALSDYADDRALELLVKAARTQATDITNREPGLVPENAARSVRWAAAQSLRLSPHPKALQHLLDLAGDPAPRVRLVVVDASAQATDPRAREVLQALAKDPDERVRARAAEALRGKS